MPASHQLLEMQQLENCSDHRLSHIGSLEPHTIAKATTRIDTSSEWDIGSPVYLIGCNKPPENFLMFPFMFLVGGDTVTPTRARK